MNESRINRKKGSFLRRTTAQLAVVGLVAAGSIALFATTASADSPNPQSASGIADLNGDGSITVSVVASWTWDMGSCPASDDQKVPGWAVDWGDNSVNEVVDPIFVGTASDNAVHFNPAFDGQDPAQCTDNGSTIGGAFPAPLSHTYSADFVAANAADMPIPCVVTYDVHKDKVGDTGGHSAIAGGDDRNDDNSVDNNKEDPESGCLPAEFAPDVKIVKTGPSTGTVGTAFSYTLTATNTGLVPATNTTITDVLPAGVTFGSATAPCAYNSGTRTVTCNVGTLNAGQSTAVTLTVTPTASGTLSNTATITPADGTPEDNTSTWVIGNIQAAAEVVIQPAFTG
jgi:uncharacterized repeat protein (TIGR01451 family)